MHFSVIFQPMSLNSKNRTIDNGPNVSKMTFKFEMTVPLTTVETRMHQNTAPIVKHRMLILFVFVVVELIFEFSIVNRTIAFRLGKRHVAFTDLSPKQNCNIPSMTITLNVIEMVRTLLRWCESRDCSRSLPKYVWLTNRVHHDLWSKKWCALIELRRFFSVVVTLIIRFFFCGSEIKLKTEMKKKMKSRQLQATTSAELLPLPFAHQNGSVEKGRKTERKKERKAITKAAGNSCADDGATSTRRPMGRSAAALNRDGESVRWAKITKCEIENT